MKKYTIIISKDAKKDISEIYNYIAENDIVGKAKILLAELKKILNRLSFLPHRGHNVHELNSRKLLEIYYKPYRIIYSITDNAVIIIGVLDGRRDLKKLLLKRFADIKMEIF